MFAGLGDGEKGKNLTIINLYVVGMETKKYIHIYILRIAENTHADAPNLRLHACFVVLTV